MTELDSLEPWHDFSLVLGGPLFQLLRKAHLEGDHLELLKRRLLVITLIAWLPLLETSSPFAVLLLTSVLTWSIAI